MSLKIKLVVCGLLVLGFCDVDAMCWPNSAEKVEYRWMGKDAPSAMGEVNVWSDKISRLGSVANGSGFAVIALGLGYASYLAATLPYTPGIFHPKLSREIFERVGHGVNFSCVALMSGYIATDSFRKAYKGSDLERSLVAWYESKDLSK